MVTSYLAGNLVVECGGQDPLNGVGRTTGKAKMLFRSNVRIKRVARATNVLHLLKTQLMTRAGTIRDAVGFSGENTARWRVPHYCRRDIAPILPTG